MPDLPIHDSAAINELAFYMLKEAYTAAVRALTYCDAAAARNLVEGVEKTIAYALQSMHDGRTEGPESTAIALALGTRLANAFDEAHGAAMPKPTPQALTSAPVYLAASGQAFAYFARLKLA